MFGYFFSKFLTTLAKTTPLPVVPQASVSVIVTFFDVSIFVDTAAAGDFDDDLLLEPGEQAPSTSAPIAAMQVTPTSRRPGRPEATDLGPPRMTWSVMFFPSRVLACH